MQLPSWAVVTVAVIAAFPFGWDLGVVAAYLLAGSDFGQLPALTVPLGIAAAIIFALLPAAQCAKEALDHGCRNRALHPPGPLTSGERRRARRLSPTSACSFLGAVAPPAIQQRNLAYGLMCWISREPEARRSVRFAHHARTALFPA